MLKEKKSLDEIIFLLKAKNDALKALYAQADKVRSEYIGEAVYLRGIIEISNYCKKNCYYCGIRKGNKNVERYRIGKEEIIETCKKIEKFGQTTVVLQAGEDLFFDKERMGDIISGIKKETGLAITVSLGEQATETYRYWQKMGMDRYLIRFETSNRDLFKKYHPDDDFDERIKCIENLKKLGVQTGSGFLIGLPEESYEDLARDILFCTDLDLDMIGVGPFISNEDTPLAGKENVFEPEVYFKVIAILRLLNKKAHIPSTTAFDAIDPNGRNLLLQRGANVFMPNATPKKYRKHYLLYPGKPCVDESSEDCAGCVMRRVSVLGREIGRGPGHSLKI